MKSLSAFLFILFIVLSVGSLGVLIFVSDNILTIGIKIIFFILALIFLYFSVDIYVKNEIAENTDATADLLNSINEKLDKLVNKNPEEKEDKDA